VIRPWEMDRKEAERTTPAQPRVSEAGAAYPEHDTRSAFGEHSPGVASGEPSQRVGSGEPSILTSGGPSTLVTSVEPSPTPASSGWPYETRNSVYKNDTRPPASPAGDWSATTSASPEDLMRRPTTASTTTSTLQPSPHWLR
jgi:hypothetical protein